MILFSLLVASGDQAPVVNPTSAALGEAVFVQGDPVSVPAFTKNDTGEWFLSAQLLEELVDTERKIYDLEQERFNCVNQSVVRDQRRGFEDLSRAANTQYIYVQMHLLNFNRPIQRMVKFIEEITELKRRLIEDMRLEHPNSIERAKDVNSKVDRLIEKRLNESCVSISENLKLTLSGDLNSATEKLEIFMPEDGIFKVLMSFIVNEINERRKHLIDSCVSDLELSEKEEKDRRFEIFTMLYVPIREIMLREYEGQEEMMRMVEKNRGEILREGTILGFLFTTGVSKEQVIINTEKMILKDRIAFTVQSIVSYLENKHGESIKAIRDVFDSYQINQKIKARRIKEEQSNRNDDGAAVS